MVYSKTKKEKENGGVTKRVLLLGQGGKRETDRKEKKT